MAEVSYDLYENNPYLGSHGWVRGKGHIYKFHDVDKSNADRKKEICEWVKNKYPERYGFDEYDEGDDYVVRIAYAIV